MAVRNSLDPFREHGTQVVEVRLTIMDEGRTARRRRQPAYPEERMEAFDRAASGRGSRRWRSVAVVAVCAALSVLLPAIPILLGVLVIGIFGGCAASPDLLARVEQLLRLPPSRSGMRHARLSILAGTGLMLVVVGAVGATTRGWLRVHLQQDRQDRELAGESLDLHLRHARESLAGGDVAGAELALLDAAAFAATAGDRKDLDELLSRLRRSGDHRAILDILVRLPRNEFEAFEQGTAVPDALEFPEQALTARAVEIGLAQLDEARMLRARR